jgi:uncharacterized protein (DUF362 family)
MMRIHRNRREFLGAMGLAAGAYLAEPASLLAQAAPASRVAIGSCPEYNRQVVEVLSTMFDQLGGLESLVSGKTVAIKLNMTGLPTARLQYLPAQMTHWVHPQVIWAVMSLLEKAGARRIRLLESAWSTSEPLEEFMISSGWQPEQLRNAARRVEFENTNFLGKAKSYSRVMVPGGGLMCQGYDLNSSYEDCDVFFSLAKLKQHRTTGVTLSVKNCFGIIPCTIYGSNVPEDEPSLVPVGGRGPFHDGSRTPPRSAPALVDVNAPKEGGYRVPRAAADLVAARPVHLAIIDGIYSMVGGELPDQPGRHAAIHPGLLIAGKNCVCTDAVGTAVMGFDPSADRGTPPFKNSDNMLRLAERLGVGTRDLNRIEVIGTPLSKARSLYSRALERPEQVTDRV